MTRYADPQRCPDCLHAIDQGTTACPSCGLSLVGPVAGRLFQTLAYADELLTALRTTQPAVVPAPAEPAPAATSAPPPAKPTTPWSPSTQVHATRGLSAASVPKILLGLGAICLLVAALVFLAVTWSVMGVAGRTATLVGFTGVAGGLAAWAATRNLRAAAEALSLVALGLLSFDVFGARDSGWFGDIGDAGFFALLGAVVTVAAGVAGLAVRRTPAGALVGAEIIGALGAATFVMGLVGGNWLAESAALTMAVVLTAAATFAAYRLRLLTLAVGLGVVAGLTWLALVTTAFFRAVSNPTIGELWLELEAWPLVAAAALVGGLALVRSLPLAARVTGAAVAELILAVVALIPFSQGSSTEFTLAVLLVLAVACALTWFASEPWSLGCAATAAMGAGWLVIVGGTLLAVAGARLLDVGAILWDGTVDGRLPTPVLGAPAPWLLPIATAALIAICVALARSTLFMDRIIAPLGDLAIWPAVAVGALVASGVATAALYAVPVWAVLGLLLLSGIALVTVSLPSATGKSPWISSRLSRGIGRGTTLLLGSAFMFLAFVTSLYDEWLTAVALLVALALAGAVHLRWPGRELSAVAGAVFAASLAGSVWTWGALADVEATWVALWALTALGILVLGVPAAGARAWRLYRDVPGATPDGSARTADGSARTADGSARTADGSARTADGSARSAAQRFTGTEIGALVAGFVVMTAGVAASSYSMQPTWTAVYLTAGGVVASLISLLRPDRRLVGWLGGALLATASWVRLFDLGVQAPEAYALPSAVALAIAGLVHLRRHPDSSTMKSLAPSLGLALVPSLLWVISEPVGLRSLLLGLACLALLVLGVRLQWTAPVVFAATVGTLVVLRHVAPAAEAVPQWVLIGAAGTLLVAMGITWERRIQEARAVVGYVRALR